MPLIQSIPQTYCGTCHLSTRMDVPRCLHCNKPLRPAPVKAVRKSGPKLPVQVKSKPLVVSGAVLKAAARAQRPARTSI